MNQSRAHRDYARADAKVASLEETKGALEKALNQVQRDLLEARKERIRLRLKVFEKIVA